MGTSAPMKTHSLVLVLAFPDCPWKTGQTKLSVSHDLAAVDQAWLEK